MEGQPICLKLGKFAGSRADHELGHERAQLVFTVRERAVTENS
jgi:hypothetical protein